MAWGNSDFIVFASNRFPGGYDNDIFVFDPLQDTVLAVVGVNTPFNEFNPRISDNGHWLVFQRTIPGHAGHCRWSGYGDQDILLYSMDAKLVNTLHSLNTDDWDEFMPDITNDGCKIVYVSDEGGCPSLRLYDVTTGDNWIIPGANRNFADITWPTISANGLKIAYGASTSPGYGVATDGTGHATGGPAVTGNALWPGESNVYVYDVAHGVQLTPPFVNTAFDEYNPEFCLDGSRMLFVSNRLGTEDIFETNFDTGLTDNLSFLNSPNLDEQQPRYLGGNIDRIVFQIKAPDYPSPVALRAYNRTSATLDTLPVANSLFADSALRAPQPEVADVGF
jgi:Tol biopolymer transport system component